MIIQIKGYVSIYLVCVENLIGFLTLLAGLCRRLRLVKRVEINTSNLPTWTIIFFSVTLPLRLFAETTAHAETNAALLASS
jgi:hypothetical protein